MADESCDYPGESRTPGQWLDHGTAERLLSGGTDAQSGEAGELARLLGALGAGPGTGLLPGEDEAVAAFRAVRRARGEAVRRERVGSVAGAGFTPGQPPGAEDAGGPPVRLGGAAAGRGGTVRWGRPLRFGLAAALAGCMIGGVAVAAGAGMLPFGGSGGPAPAVSVSGEATPQHPLGSDVPPSSSSGSPSSPSSHGPADPDHEHRAADSGDPSGAADQGKDGRGRPGGTTKGHGDKGSATGDGSDAWWQQLVASCRDYRGGKQLDGDSRRGLEDAAHGPEGVQKFCDTVLGSDGPEQPSADPADGYGSHEGGGTGDQEGPGSGAGSTGEDKDGQGDGQGGQGDSQGGSPDKGPGQAPGKDTPDPGDDSSVPPSDSTSQPPGV